MSGSCRKIFRRPRAKIQIEENCSAAAYTKNSEVARIPLRCDLVESLKHYLAERDFQDVVWTGTWSDDGAEMIRIDLAEAGIEYTNIHGDDYDFHALRHQFISDLAKAGVSLKAAQELARHSKPELTANIYTHLSLKDTAVEVEKLASVPTESSPTGEDQQEGDFGPAPGTAHWPARSAIQADLSHEQAIPVNLLAQEKSPVFAGKTGLFESDADGTRTRNLRIDSPGL